jgi:IMP dehydrogenase/GMP reductase
MIGGLRAGMGYCGAHTISDLHKANLRVLPMPV